jgi:hypothetical protein
VLVNIGGYYDRLLSFLDVAVDQGFLKPGNYALIQVVESTADALKCMQKLWQSLPVSHVAPAKPAP